jgi:tRNA(fMet)-specific endonuclease VapC
LARLILDTMVLIDAERGGATIDRLLGDNDDVAIAAITAAELLVGVELANRRRRPGWERYVDEVFATLPIESYDLDVARLHASLLVHVRRAGIPRGAHDLIVAATALARDRVVVSTDEAAFRDLPGLTVIAA